VRYRVDHLAARAGVSVDTVRFYQRKGLLDSPRREGRVAWYSEDHLAALSRIRDLKHKGFTLESIRRLLSGELEGADDALFAALSGAGRAPEEKDGERLSLDELARRTGMSEALLLALEREGLLAPETSDVGPTYSGADAAAISAGLRLLEAGVPFAELLALAREQEDAMRRIAERAIDLFDSHVRRPVLAAAPSEEEAAGRLVAAVEAMFPAATSLVAHQFGRVLLATARQRLGGEALPSKDAQSPHSSG
jgi:DNA-binding transcriptional MerR regulator